MGHGTHWEAVLTNLEEDFAVAIDLGIQKGEVVGIRHHENWSGPLGKRASDVTLIQSAKSGFGALGIVISADSRTYLHSAFPVSPKGMVPRVRVLEIHESSFGLERVSRLKLAMRALIFSNRTSRFNPTFTAQVLN